jgi:RNA polymerase sigma-70 factor (ECF subfamily)
VSEFQLTDPLRDEMRASWHRFLDLLTPFRPALHAYCRRLAGNLWDGEDLAQDTLLRSFGALAQLHDPVRNPRAYVLRTATHLWIDKLRRRESEAAALAETDAPTAASSDPGAVRDAGQALLQRLAPRERAAVILKDVFDLSLEESAEVLETTIGAVKAALHRGRARLREPEPESDPKRPLPSPALVDRFVELFNAEDKPGLLKLVLDNATVENVGIGMEWGADGHRSPKSWFEGALGGHPEWPAVWRYESRRAEGLLYRGEPIVGLFTTRRGAEALEGVIRFEQQESFVSRMRCYSFCPEITRAVGEELGLTVRTGIYRYPTLEPGVSYPKPGEEGGAS